MSAKTLSFTLWPFEAVTTEAVLAAPTPKDPIPLIVYADPEPTDFEEPIPGTDSTISDRSNICCAAISSALNASTANATS